METKQNVVPLLRELQKNSRRPELADLYKELLKEAKAEVREHSVIQSWVYETSPRLFLFTDFREVGEYVVLLYCAALFQNACEREQCVLKSAGQISYAELDHILSAASRLLRSPDKLPVIDKQTGSILSKVCTSSYFVKEDIHQSSRVLLRLNEYYNKTFADAGQPVQQEFMTAYQKLLSIYEAADFLHYDWRKCNRLNIACSEPARDKFNVDPLVLLRAIPRCTILASLTCRRPHRSLLPHAEAVMVCIEHAILWLKGCPMRVFYPLELTYADITESISDENQILLENLWNNTRCPSYVERLLRMITLKQHSPYRRKLEPFLSGGKLYHLKAEDYDWLQCYGVSKRIGVSKKDIAVAKLIARPYRTKTLPVQPQNYQHRQRACVDTLWLLEDHWMDEPPQYDHVFEYKRPKKQLRRQEAKKAKLQKQSE